jgi:hypothetical protein
MSYDIEVNFFVRKKKETLRHPSVVKNLLSEESHKSFGNVSEDKGRYGAVTSNYLIE